MTPTKIAIGEYANYFGYDDGTVWTHDNNKLSKYAVPEKGTLAIAGHPYGYLIGDSGALYMLTGDNTAFKKIADGVKLVGAYWNWCVVVFKDNSIGVFKDGVIYSAMLSPGKVVQIAAAHRIVIRCEDGSVWEYEWSSVPWKSGIVWQKTEQVLATLQPKKVLLPGPATWITTSRLFFSAAIVNGDVYAWGDSFAARYFPAGFGVTPKVVPAPAKMTVVEASDHNLHAIDTEGFGYGQGGLGVGFVGNGKKEPEVEATGGWPNMVVKTFVTSFVKLGDRKYKQIVPGTSYKFRFGMQETNDVWNFWGYPKFGLDMTGIRPFDDPAFVGALASASPQRRNIPDVLVPKTTAELKVAVANKTYPPAEYVPVPPVPVKKVVATLYDDGTWEKQ